MGFSIKKPDTSGELSSRAFLTNKQVLEIRFLYKTKTMTQGKIAKQYGTTHTNICRIVNYKTWRNI